MSVNTARFAITSLQLKANHLVEQYEAQKIQCVEYLRFPHILPNRC